MGYFDKVAAAAFKETSDGMTVYYPNGVIGKGRLVTNDEEKEKLFRYHKRLYKVLMFVGIPYGWLLGLSGVYTVGTIAPIAILAALMFLHQYRLIRELPKHEMRLGLNEAIAKSSNALPNWYYWLFGTLSVVGLFLAVTLPFQLEKTYKELLVPVIGFGSFGLLGLSLSIKFYRAKNT